jgi:hypothetical protein
MIVQIPKPHRQLWTLFKNDSAALDPTKAEMIAGDEVKANASPRFLRFVTSAARTSQVYE